MCVCGGKRGGGGQEQVGEGGNLGRKSKQKASDINLGKTQSLKAFNTPRSLRRPPALTSASAPQGAGAGGQGGQGDQGRETKEVRGAREVRVFPQKA